jgi:hypothetical protein
MDSAPMIQGDDPLAHAHATIQEMNGMYPKILIDA